MRESVKALLLFFDSFCCLEFAHFVSCKTCVYTNCLLNSSSFFVSSSSHTSLFKCYLFNEQIDCELWNDDTQDAVNGYESLQSTNDDSTSQLRVEGWVEKTFFSVQQEVNLITWVTQVPHFLRCSRTTCSNLRCPSLSVLKSLHGL